MMFRLLHVILIFLSVSAALEGANLPLAYVPGYDVDEGGIPFTPPLTVPIWIILSGYCIYKGALGDKKASAKNKILHLFFMLFLTWCFSLLAGFFLFLGWGIISA